MNPVETIQHIRDLCEDAANRPTYLTFVSIAEWCEKQMRAMNPASEPDRAGQHTPKPWKVETRTRSFISGMSAKYETFIVTHNNGTRGKLICEGGNSQRGFVEENEANIRLIAAAPELLEACQTARAYVAHGRLPQDQGADTPNALQLETERREYVARMLDSSVRKALGR
jgi:hypothetical protein